MLKHWYNVELTKEQAELFRAYILEHGHDFEASEAGNLVHFEINITADEALFTNTWLANNLKVPA